MINQRKKHSNKKFPLLRPNHHSKNTSKSLYKDLTNAEPSEIELKYIKEIEQYTNGLPEKPIVADHINDENYSSISNNIDSDDPVDMIISDLYDASRKNLWEASRAEVEACAYLYKECPAEERVIHSGYNKILPHGGSSTQKSPQKSDRLLSKRVGIISNLRNHIASKTFPSFVYQIQKQLDDPYANDPGKWFKFKSWIMFKIYRIVSERKKEKLQWSELELLMMRKNTKDI